ncbi:MAG: permease [Candidatus Hydrothermarchaeales archaeon]
MNPMVLAIVLLTIILYGAVFLTNSANAKLALKAAFDLFVDPDVGLVPLIVAAILLAGLIEALIPRETITAFLGREAGLRGIALGTLFGALTPGGPYVSFPIAGAIYHSGAGVGTTMAFLSAWSMLALSRIPLEIPFVGAKIVAVRLVVSLSLPIIIGVVGQGLYNILWHI